MSLENARAFHAKVQSDPALQAKVRQHLVPKRDLPGLVATASAAGFAVTASEVSTVLDGVAASDGLSDFELEMVSAGGAMQQS